MTEQELIELWGDGSEFGLSPNGELFMNNAFREVAIKFALVVADKECVKGYNEGYGEGRYDGYEEEHAPLVISDAIVICEIVDTIDGTYASDYIRNLVVESKIKQSTEEYELYLKLKEKFEK